MSEVETERLLDVLRQHGSKAGKLRGMLWGVLNTDVARELGLQSCAESFLQLTARLLYASGMTLDVAHERLRTAWRDVIVEVEAGDG